MLEVANLTVRFGAVTAFEDVSLQLAPGEIVALVGHNGAGKTTLLRAICGLQRVDAGSIRLDGASLGGLSADRIARRDIAYVPQGRGVFGEMSVQDNLRIARMTARGAGLDDRRLFDLFPVLEEKRRQPAHALSGGQQQMLALSIALARGPRYILLDEPSTGLAPVLVQSVFETITRLNRELETAFLVIDQNVEALLAMTSRAYVLKAGRMIHDGASDQLSGSAMWAYF